MVLHGTGDPRGDESRWHRTRDRQYLYLSHAVLDAARDSGVVVGGFVADGVGGSQSVRIDRAAGISTRGSR